MAITVRQGPQFQFDINKMLPGEFAVTTDTHKVYVCMAAGVSKELASVEELKYVLSASDDAFAAFQELLRAMDNNSVVTGLLTDINTIKAGEYVISFSEAEEINNIESTDTIKVILGKIKKFFSSLSDVAFSGNYNDISDTPDLSDVALTGKSVDVTYDNSTSGLEAENVQGAIDEVSEKTVKNSSDISVLNTKLLSDTGWVNVTGVPGLSYRKIGNVVNISTIAGITVSNVKEWVTIATLPNDLKPAKDIYITVLDSTNEVAMVRVTPGGLLQGYSINSAIIGYFTMIYTV